MWKNLIAKLDAKCTFYPPASVDQIAEVERRLGLILPPDLVGLLQETNGVRGSDYLYDFLNTEQITKVNLQIRGWNVSSEIYMPLDCFLFFASPGNGDQFGYAITTGGQFANIHGWNHETDSRPFVAFHLAQFVEQWIQGKIKI